MNPTTIGERMRLLVVEDDPTDLELLRLLLRGVANDLALVHAESLERALREVERAQVDVVLLDLGLPDARGMATLHRLLAAAPDLPIVVWTGDRDDAMAVAAVKAGAQDYLVKGVADGETLMRALRYALGRKRADETVRKIEDQLRQAQKLDIVGRLVGGIAHDFNNLLSALIGFCDLALAETPGSSPVAEYLREIRAAGDRGTSLISRLLSFTRRSPVDPRALSLNAFLDDLRKLMRRLIREDIDLVLDLEPGLDPVWLDPAQLQQVLMNLVVNASEAIGRGGRITIATRQPRAAETTGHVFIAAGSHLVLEVRDTGCGMSEDVMAQAFEPFFTTKERGTGLGLSIVSEILTQGGGHIEVTSESGRGTTFTVFLPRAQQPAATPMFGEAPMLVSGNETVLVVEDEPAIRKLLRSVLAAAGYRVLVASDGLEGLELSRHHPEPIDLLIADMIMPGMSGRDLARCLSLSRPGLRTLLISGYCEGFSVDDSLPFMAKPFSPAAVRQKVREVLDARVAVAH